MSTSDPLSNNQVQHLRELDKSVVWHAFSQMQNYEGLIIQHAKGAWLHAVDGRRYLDGASSLWCNIHGHCHPDINHAISQQLAQVSHVTGLGMSHPETIRLAQRLVELSPKSLQHVFFCSDGACAVEVAMKMAFQYWRQCPNPKPEKTKFVALGNAYHGDTLGTVALGGVEQFHSLFKPLLFPVLRGPCPVAARNEKLHLEPSGEAASHQTQRRMDEPHNQDKSQSAWSSSDNSSLCRVYLQAYRALFEKHGHEIAGVVVEPLLQCSAGMVFHPPGFLAGIAELCKEFDLLLIIDEIAVGMGRTGSLFVSEQEQVEPDLLCIGKGLTGGYLPMSATLTSSKIFEAFLGEASKTLYHGHTYGGNALSAAAANATLDLTIPLLQSSDFVDRVNQLESGLLRIRNLPGVKRVDQLGMLAVVELQTPSHLENLPAKNSAVNLAKTIYQRMLNHEVWLRPLGNCIPIVPPLSITETELKILIDVLHDSIQAVMTEG